MFKKQIKFSTMTIKKITAREILDSRGTPTVETQITLENGTVARASVPSGASTGENEAMEIRDNDHRYNGNGVQKAVNKINKEIAPALEGKNPLAQRDIDRLLLETDGTADKRNLGANAILAVSLAVAKAAAKAMHTSLYRYIGGVNAHVMPTPMINIINGGKHSDSPIAFQEFMIRPVGADSISEGIRMGAEVFHTLKRVLHKKGYSTAVGDEGGFAPQLHSIEEALSLIVAAIKESGYRPGEDIMLAIDCASSEFYRDSVYDYGTFENDGARLTTTEQIGFLTHLIDSYPIDSIEDGIAESDWEGWRELTRAIGKRCHLVGDDLFVTNVRYLQRGIREKCGNSILIKPNQIGTLTETLDTIELARRNGYSTIISHRSGETEETFIADLAVATNSGLIKTGSMSRGERTAKYNRLIRIEEELGKSARYGL